MSISSVNVDENQTSNTDQYFNQINENTDEPLYKLISNAPITAKLKVIKIVFVY